MTKKRRFQISQNFICCLLSVILFTYACIPVTANGVDSSLNDYTTCWEYTSLYLDKVAHYDATLIREDILYDYSKNQPTAILYSFENGYAIFRLEGSYVCEYSSSAQNPYHDFLNSHQLYYEGPFEYYVLSKNQLINVTTGQPVTITNNVNQTDNLATNAQPFSFSDLQTKISLLQNHSSLSINTVTQSRSLPRSLSTSWVNGYCGPTSAHAMLNYRGLVESGYTGTQLINRIANYTGTSVSLSSLKNGINNYLSANINTSIRVSSCSYSFSKVVTEINAGRPLTLGTNGGGLASGGHVQTVHGYYRESLGTGTIEYFTLYVNNSWGSNNVAISYENSAPTYLKDHVYFTS